MESQSSLLIIFYRNPVLGKVKTRLAKNLGDTKALEVYSALVDHTKSVTDNVDVGKWVFYSDEIREEDCWSNSSYNKHTQSGITLGNRMANAFREGFKSGYSSICIIGSDCFELTDKIIKEAFENLNAHETVIGPALDGGYYLLGMNSFYPELFENKAWSTNTVFSRTIRDFERKGLLYHILPVLRDVDEIGDLPDALRTRL